MHLSGFGDCMGVVLDGVSIWLEDYFDTNKVYVSYTWADMGQEV